MLSQSIKKKQHLFERYIDRREGEKHVYIMQKIEFLGMNIESENDFCSL